MKVFRDSQVAKVDAAIKQDPRIQTTLAKLPESEGFTAAYFAELGVSHTLLAKMERWGLAKRGYARLKDGHRARWILVSPGSNDGKDAAGQGKTSGVLDTGPAEASRLPSR